VEQNIAFGLKGLPKGEIADRVIEMLALVRLDGLARRRPDQLSGGQQQRVALARAIAPRPKVLLLDEPLAALDKKLREETQFELINLQEKLGVTFIVVTHDQEEAMTLASRIGVMDRGEIVQVGTPTEIYEYPSSKFVADFIGSVNMFEGRLIEDEPNFIRIQSPELNSTIYVDHGISAPPGASVWAAIRPEKIEIAREEPESTENRARGVVRDIAYMGDMSIYLVKIDSGKMIRVTLPNSVRQLSQRISWDETVWLSWDASSPVVLPQ
jgi:putrescine transport system ATP-binding protein